MFCGNCGAANPDDAKVCGSCGLPLDTEDAPVSALSAPSDAKRNKTIGLVAVGVAALVVLALVIWLVVALLGGGANKVKHVAERYVEAMLEGDAREVVDCCIPPDYIREMKDQGEIDGKSDLVDEMEDFLERYVTENLEDTYGSDYKVKVEANEPRELKKSDLRDLKDAYKEEMDVRVEDARKVKVKATVSGDGEKDTESNTIIVVKIDGKWYADLVATPPLMDF